MIRRAERAAWAATGAGTVLAAAVGYGWLAAHAATHAGRHVGLSPVDAEPVGPCERRECDWGSRWDDGTLRCDEHPRGTTND